MGCGREKARDEEAHLIDARINNPNLEVLEDRLAVRDGAGRKALAFSHPAWRRSLPR